MSVFSQLFEPIRLSVFVRDIYTLIGPTAIIIALIAFVTLLAYANALPTSGGAFGHLTDVRYLGIGFFNQILAAFTVILLFTLLFTENLFLIFIFLSILIAMESISVLLNKGVKDEWLYEDYVERDKRYLIYLQLRSKDRTIPKTPIKYLVKPKRVSPLTFYLTFFAVLVFTTIMSIIVLENPVLPFVCWIVVASEFLILLINVAKIDGVVRRFTKAPYLGITLKNETYTEAYIMAVGTDHFIIITKNERKVLYTSNIIEMKDMKNPETLS